MIFEEFMAVLFPVLLIIINVLIVYASYSRDWEYKIEVTIIIIVLFLDMLIITLVYPYIKLTNEYNIWMIVLWLYTPSVATIVGGIAYLNYRRKSGVDIRLQFTYAEIGKGNNKFQSISSMQLYNFKDKAEHVYAIYLMNKKREYLQLCVFPDEKPVVIKAFEIEKIDLKYYRFSPEETVINLFDHKSFKVVLSTSKGQYIVRKPIYIWCPKKYYKSFL